MKGLLQKLKNSFLESKIITTILLFSKRVSLPGFEKIPIYDVLSFFFKGLANGAITTRASSMAFNFFLALFPSTIFLFTLIPYVPIDNFQDQLIELLRQVMPKSAYEATESTIIEIVKNQNGSLLSIGFFSALYFSTNGVNSMIDAFQSSVHAVENRTFIQQRLICILLVIITTTLLILATVLTIFSEYVLNHTSTLGLGDFTSFMIGLGRVVIVFGLFFTLISCMYYFGPSKKAGWKFVSAGSMLATILALLTSIGFAYYVNNFGQYNKLYGSIGTLIVMLLWIYFNSLVLILGFELNASIHTAKKK